MSNTDLLGSDAVSAAPGSQQDSAPAPRTESKETPLTTTKRRAGLSGMVLAELRELAGQLNISGTAGMRKGDLIAAIKERQGSSGGRAETAELPLTGVTASKPARRTAEKPARAADGKKEKAAEAKAEAPAPVEAPAPAPAPEASAPAETAPAPRQGEEEGGRRNNRRRRTAGRPAGAPDSSDQQQSSASAGDRPQQGERQERQDRQDRQQGDRGEQRDRGDRQQGDRGEQRDRGDRQRDRNDRGSRGDRQQGNNRPDNRQQDDDDDERGGRRGRRFRDRRRGRDGVERGQGGGGGDTEVRDDDVLLPVAGILDVLENYAFVRTSGYLAGPNDVYVSLSLVRKHGLRRGDNITGAVRQPREGEQQRQKFNPLVRVDTINGLEPDQVRNRPEFTKLTPLYPNERLRLETEPHILTTRVIDLVMPVGKGQRALIVSPPKAGKTSVLQSIANAITTNNPECHLMVVLVDERPEEVTDMQRSVKGEVIASTFDRPPGDHTSVAELSIERAKRLVEMGHDVVVLLDSITRLGRAYNLAAPASGRILSGGVDSTALYPPKRFLGAARNIEGGGSLTIFATALVETGSTMDTVIFEEFKGTGNAELKLDRRIADKRVFPAVDVDPSGTRKEELLLPPDELAVMHKLRRVLHALDSQQAIDLLLDRLRKSRTNIEFLMQVAKTTPGSNGDD
ncbi:transcription termination factor Rho [Kutzneria sp. NPDC052558]|uniref:transcription termination factor Rho n=1 Tax=Kutzneria sp. NPDC052558 TaxID=3364121 RepID=UPI0037CB6E24